MFTKTSLALLAMLLVASTVVAQNKAEKALQKLDELYPQEKIHLFLNKEAYVAGETVWFKSYLFSGNVQSNISKTLYVELLNEEKGSVAQALVPLVNAVGESSISLPDNLPEGNYFLRAYTKWMLNFDESFQYLYHIPVFNPKSPNGLTPKKVDYTVAIYPESGTLLAGIENKMAVRLSAKGSLPSKWEGFITEGGAPGKKLLSFSSLNPQLASFNFLPEAGKSYELHTMDNSGNKKVLLVQPSTNGVALKAKQSGSNIIVEPFVQGLENGSNYKLVAAADGQLIYSAILKTIKPGIELTIPVSKLLAGVVQLTLFNEAEKPLAERLVFVQPGTEPPVQVSTPVISNTSRGLNEWILNADTSLRSTFAVAVSDATLTQPRMRSIKSDLWLGDFVSDIYHPHSYFSNDRVNSEALDALLITEKWNRYNWQTLLADNFPVIHYKPEQYLTYKGTALVDGQKAYEVPLSLIFKYKDSSVEFYQVKTDKNGQFFLNNFAFYDSVEVYQLPGKVKKAPKPIALQFERNNKFAPFRGQLPSTPYTLTKRSPADTAMLFIKHVLNDIQNQNKLTGKNSVLEGVTIKTKTKTPTQELDEKLSSPLFSTGNPVVIDFVNEEQNVLAYNNIFDWLESRVAGLTFAISNNDILDPLTGATIQAGQRIPIIRGEQPTIFVDETVTDFTFVHNLMVNEIAMIKIMKGYFLGASGGGGGGGAIAIYTKRPGMTSDKITPNKPSGILGGYTAAKEYPHINFGNDLSSNITRDTRQQLYWSTQLFSDSNTKGHLKFYNNDLSTTYRITVSGFTKNAEVVFMEKEIGKEDIKN